MSFVKEAFNRDFNKMLVQVGAVITVVYGLGVIASRLSK